jgi:hypothetical protein
MEVDGQLHAAASLTLRNEPLVTVVLEAGLIRPSFVHWATKAVISGIYRVFILQVY